MAPGRLSLLLVLEITIAGRAAGNRERPACADPANEYRQSTLGAPRIHGELLKLGFEVAQSTVAKYMIKRWGPPSQGWRTFLQNHAPDIGAMDLFVVPTISFNLLYAFAIVRLDRRKLVWINVTRNPTAEWIARQLTEAFPGMGRHVTSSAIMTASMATSPCAAFVPWASGTSQQRRLRLGRMALLNGWSAQSGASASITSSSLARRTCVGSCKVTSTITIKSGPIGRWPKMHLLSARFSRSGRLRHTLFSAAFITNMFEFEFSVQTGLHHQYARI